MDAVDVVSVQFLKCYGSQQPFFWLVVLALTRWSVDSSANVSLEIA